MASTRPATSVDGDCSDCLAGWEHCHGTVIRHSYRRSECTEDGCVSSELVSHVFSIDCDAVGCACGRPTAVARSN